jgi:MFS family permease
VTDLPFLASANVSRQHHHEWSAVANDGGPPVSDQTRAPAEGPATFRELFSVREYRALYAATTLAWAGDYIAKAAVSMLVYQQSNSVALSAAAFAVSFLPWLVGGPLLATLAERHPYRTVMVVCDTARMVLITLILLQGMRPEVNILLLFIATLAAPPSQAARSALLPLILTGDRLVVGLSVNSSTNQAAQIGGYAAGAALAAINPRLALLINAATFGASALLIRLGIQHRPSAMTREHRSHLLRETGEGFRMVFGTPVLRAVALMVFAAMLFAIIPEGLAAGWAGELTDEGAGRGVVQALIMVAAPLGFILGSLVISRAVAPARRQALVRPLGVLAPLALTPALLNPPPLVVAVLAAISGFAVAGLMPTANGLFVRALPHGFRARAAGVMNSGMQLLQGGSVLLTGVLAERFSIPRVVGLWSLAGVALMILMALQWPTPERFRAAIAEAERSAPAPTPAPGTPDVNRPAAVAAAEAGSRAVPGAR